MSLTFKAWLEEQQFPRPINVYGKNVNSGAEMRAAIDGHVHSAPPQAVWGGGQYDPEIYKNVNAALAGDRGTLGKLWDIAARDPAVVRLLRLNLHPWRQDKFVQLIRYFRDDLNLFGDQHDDFFDDPEVHRMWTGGKQQLTQVLSPARAMPGRGQPNLTQTWAGGRRA